MENHTHEDTDTTDPRPRGRWLRVLANLDAYKRVTETVSDEDLATTRRTLETIARELGPDGLRGLAGGPRGHRGHHPGHPGAHARGGHGHHHGEGHGHRGHGCEHHRGERDHGVSPREDRAF
ncbi:hypothetical protein ACOKGD_01640 [Microbacterium phosphatis]|uniref:hypothetical protein n=1 Tax=Microbacterium phosphatis TaxID=3140248 RepID=UPI0031400DAB